MDPRISGTESSDLHHPSAAPIERQPLFAADDDPAAVRTDQGHRQLDPGASPLELAVSFRQMAFENATLAATCLEERRRTNDELTQIRAALTLRETPVHVHHAPPGYKLLVMAVVVVTIAQLVEVALLMHFFKVW